MKMLYTIPVLFAVGCLFILMGCQKASKDSIQKSFFGKTSDGVAVDLYTLKNKNGMEAKITNYGGTLVSLMVPDRKVKLGDVVLGYDNLSSYISNSPFFGCIVGRYGNRIAKGRFRLNGVEYRLAVNNGPNHLHGGIKGFDKAVWNAESVAEKDGVGLKLSYVSKDGEEGYPGTLNVTVQYTLTDSNALKIDYTAETDKPTVVNLTHHSYFNLSAGASKNILGHELTILADRFTPVDKTLIPTGKLKSVENTPFDFRMPTKIGARINDKEEQIQFGGGYDHNFVLNGKSGTLQLVAAVSDSASGRVMEVYTTEPGMQFYSGNFLDGTITGKGGMVYEKRAAFCLETQHYPDSPNEPRFPSTVLNPGQTYQSTTIYKFLIKK